MLLILSLFFIVNVVESQEKQNKDKANLLDSSVRYGQLKNGFTYYLRKNDTPENNIDLHLIVKVGIFQKDDTQLEYAHLMEHLGFMGTKHFPNKKSYFNKPEIYYHANTSFNHTAYYIGIPSDDAEALSEVLKSFKDMTHNIILDKKSIDVQRAAVLGEIRTNNPYREWLNATIEKNLLSNTGFQYLDDEKAKKSMEDFNYEAFLKFYKDWYSPGLQAIIIVGDINLDSTEKQIHDYFSNLKPETQSENLKEAVYFPEVNLKDENRLLTVIDSLSPTLQFKIFSKRINRAFNPKTKNDFKELLLQKLYQHLVKGKSEMFEESFNPIFSDFSSNYAIDELAGGQLQVTTMGVDIDSENTKQILEQIRQALIAWKQIHSGISDAEFQLAKEELLKKLTHNNSSSSASLASRYQKHFVKGTYAKDPDEELLMFTEILKNIDLKEIQSYVNMAGDLSKNVDFIFLKNEDQKVPDYSQIKKCIKGVENMEISPIKYRKAPIIALPKIVCTSDSKDFKLGKLSQNLIGVSTITLKNGIKIILKPLKPVSDNYNGTLQLEGYRRNNLSRKNGEEYLEASIVPEIIRFTGAGMYSKFELEEFKKAHGIKLNFNFTKDIQSINGESKISELEELLNLIYLYSTQPRKDNEGFIAWKKHKKQGLKGKLTRGSSDFYMDDIYALRYPEIPRLRSEEVEDLSLKKIFQAYHKWFTSFEGYTFIVTGDFDSEEIASQLVNSLSCYPTEKSLISGSQDITGFPLKRMNETIYLKNINQAMVTLSFPIKVENNTKNIILLRHVENALNEKIWTRLRDGCYSPRAYGKWENISDGIYSFNVSFDSAIGNQEKMIEMALETFNGLKREGVTSDWLENNIRIEAHSYDRKLEYFGFFNMWPNYLQIKLANGENISSEVLQYKTLLEHFISIEDVNNAIELYLNDNFLQKYVILPE